MTSSGERFVSYRYERRGKRFRESGYALQWRKGRNTDLKVGATKARTIEAEGKEY
jgi:hypothetical protein